MISTQVRTDASNCFFRPVLRAVKRICPWSFVIAFGFILLFVGGCATNVGQHTFIQGTHVAKPSNHPIDVYTNGPPTRPFVRIAYLSAHSESQFWADPSLEHSAIPELQRQARAAGCDAIIEVQARKPGSANMETRAIYVTATGIIYK